MKDVFDMVTDVRSVINVPALTGAIDGNVYPSVRPDNSTKCDVVVNGLGITNTQDQIGSGNINIYVQPLVIGGVKYADQAKMSALGKIAAELIKSVYRPTFRLFLDDQPEPVKDTDGTYYVNIRYKYYSLQSEQVEV